MIRILGVSGSLRATSYNTALLRTAQSLLPEGAELVEGSVAGVPLYNDDQEAARTLPSSVEKLQEQIANARGLLLFTPTTEIGDQPTVVRSLAVSES